jgi:hypothetical protein
MSKKIKVTILLVLLLGALWLGLKVGYDLGYEEGVNRSNFKGLICPMVKPLMQQIKAEASELKRDSGMRYYYDAYLKQCVT